MNIPFPNTLVDEKKDEVIGLLIHSEYIGMDLKVKWALKRVEYMEEDRNNIGDNCNLETKSRRTC